jgi:cytochrome c oxidase subunit 2
VICGVDHSYMLSKVHVIPEAQFLDWYTTDPSETLSGLARSTPPATDEGPPDAHRGEQRFRLKGCVACHSTDGTQLVGPSLKGLYGRRVAVVTAGQERELMADDPYLMRSIRDPMADIVKGYPPQMTRLEVSEQDVLSLVAYLKTLQDPNHGAQTR